MKIRALAFKLAKKLCSWTLKQMLTTLPVVGSVFSIIFTGVEVLKEIKQTLAENSEAVPRLAIA